MLESENSFNMSTTFQASTPPPPSSIHLPPTPRHGKGEYQPYSPRRKSSRVSQQIQATQTAQTPPRQRRTNPPHSPDSNSRASSSNIYFPPSSPQTAPKKLTPRNSPTMGGRKVSGALSHHSTVEAASALGLQQPRNASKIEAQQSALRNGMLPTPARTPQNFTLTNPPAAISSVARTLFPIRGDNTVEVMPSPKKKGRKKYKGFTLDSFEAEEDGLIPIFTDSHDRVPEVDMSANNPFYGESTIAIGEPIKRSSKRRKVVIPHEEEEQTISDGTQREDGLVYVFRGKKVFRKFKDSEIDDTGSVGQPDVELEPAERHLEYPLTRSSIKPRLLFPTSQQIKAKEARSQVTEDEEEATTDIEDPSAMDEEEKITTPKPPRFAPASPPTTARVTRSKDVLMSSPARPASDDEIVPPGAPRTPRGGKLSPFDGWSQSKSIAGGKKRGGEALTKARGAKKTRG